VAERGKGQAFLESITAFAMKLLRKQNLAMILATCTTLAPLARG